MSPQQRDSLETVPAGPGAMVSTPLGRRKLDNTGSAVGAARLNPVPAFRRISDLIQDYINNRNEAAWPEIKRITDGVYGAAAAALDALEAAEPFAGEVTAQLKAGKRLFFKVNLVTLPHIDYKTHGLGIPGASTEWAFCAAVMRWFHDRLDISYHRMNAGEASPNINVGADLMSRRTGTRVTREAVMEGRYPGGDGGWGFYYARKYLAECHDPAHRDDPMAGYEDSLKGEIPPPGRVSNKLLLYDINTVDKKTGREAPVAGGVNYQKIALHKVIIGGDPKDPQDMKDWPGCVLVNLPKLKVHISENFTCAIKNLGMGFFSMEVNDAKKTGEYKWRYSAPNIPFPTFKLNVPHGRWWLETDLETLLPKRDKNGNLIWKRTGGMEANMADIIQAVRDQGVMMLHVADAIEAVNIHNAGREAVCVPEGFVLAARDPVALDSCAARYLFTMVPMSQADDIKQKYHLKSDVIQRTPLPYIQGKNILTGQGYDSSFSRYHALKYCEERGLGQRRFYVTGTDLWEGGALASVRQRLGRVDDRVFHELVTKTMYHTPRKPVLDLQAMSFAYLELNDKLTGSHYKQELMDFYDENHDGVIDYLETGRGTSPVMLALQTALMHQPDLDRATLAKIRFLMGMVQARLGNKECNPTGEAVGGGFALSQAVAAAYEMSHAPQESPDPLYPGRTWGNGKWPSMQYILQRSMYTRLYGHAFPRRIDVFMSPYGQAFYYADVLCSGKKYCSDNAMKSRDDILARYFLEVAAGAAPLPFTFYVPSGLGSYDGKAIPNVKETDDPARVFTAEFPGGEVWKELRVSEFKLK